MTRGMCSTVHFGIPNRSIRRRSRSLFGNKAAHQKKSKKNLTVDNGSTGQEYQWQPAARDVVERRSVVVNDRGALYSRGRGRDSYTGRGRDWYYRSHSGTIFNGNFYRLQASKKERSKEEKEEAEAENATVVSNEDEPKGGRKVFSVGYVPDRCQRYCLSNKGCHSLTSIAACKCFTRGTFDVLLSMKGVLR